MALTTITQIAVAGTALDLAAFANGASLYALWAVPAGPGRRALWWRRHDLGLANDVQAAPPGAYLGPSAVVTAAGALLVAYDDATNVWIAAFDLASGAVVRTPLALCQGTRAVLAKLPQDAGSYVERIALTYVADGGTYVRETYDGGFHWSGGRPVLNAKVTGVERHSVAQFDGSHLSLVQIGTDARPFYEKAFYSRSRPVTFIRHQGNGRYYAVEAAHRVVAATEQVTDNLRGTFEVLADGTVVRGCTARVGVDDGVGDFMALDIGDGATPILAASAATGAAAGGVARVATSPAFIASSTTPGVLGASNGAVVDLCDSGTGYLHVAGYTDLAMDGAFAVVRLADAAFAQVLTGVKARAVSCQNGLIALATTEAAGERLRLYADNGLAPTPLATHKLPARANAVQTVMSDATHGAIYVAMLDRLNVYTVNGLTAPIRLSRSYTILTRGGFYDVAVTSNGNVVAALGAGGVGIFSPGGETLAQVFPSGVYAPYWTPGKAFTTGQKVRPRPQDVYAAVRAYFTAQSNGTTGGIEPAWNAAGAVADGGVSWLQGGLVDPAVTSVTLDESRNRVVAAGIVGGANATEGRIWVLDGAVQV